MNARRLWPQLIGSLLLLGAPSLSLAQPALTAVILSGASLSRSGSAPARLSLGARIASPRNSWLEIAFSDGSSIVLGPGAYLTVHQLAFDPRTRRSRIVASAGGGKIRVETADDTEADFSIGDAEVRVIAAGAVLQTTPPGSVSMLSGRDVLVSQRSRQDTLRRPGFSVALDGSGPQRDSEQQLVAAVTAFASLSASRSPSTPPPARSQPATQRPQAATLLVTFPPAMPSKTASSPASAETVSPGLTSQSGSFTLGPALQISAPSTTTVIPNLSFSGFSPSNAPSVGTPPAPGSAPPQPQLVTVDATILAGVPGISGPITVPGTGATVSATLVPSNEHLSWGFFLPTDSATPASALASPNNLVFQVSGPAVPIGTLQTLTGSATYTGGLIGSAQRGNGYVRETGQFAQTWNFGTRSGALNANFDGGVWLGIPVTMPAGTNIYAGSGASTAGQLLFSVQGSFFNSFPVKSGSFPAATGGSFSIYTNPPSSNNAGGIFVGTRH